MQGMPLHRPVFESAPQLRHRLRVPIRIVCAIHCPQRHSHPKNVQTMWGLQRARSRYLLLNEVHANSEQGGRVGLLLQLLAWSVHQRPMQLRRQCAVQHMRYVPSRQVRCQRVRRGRQQQLHQLQPWHLFVESAADVVRAMFSRLLCPEQRRADVPRVPGWQVFGGGSFVVHVVSSGHVCKFACYSMAVHAVRSRILCIWHGCKLVCIVCKRIQSIRHAICFLPAVPTRNVCTGRGHGTLSIVWSWDLCSNQCVHHMHDVSAWQVAVFCWDDCMQ